MIHEQINDNVAGTGLKKHRHDDVDVTRCRDFWRWRLAVTKSGTRIPLQDHKGHVVAQEPNSVLAFDVVPYLALSRRSGNTIRSADLGHHTCTIRRGRLALMFTMPILTQSAGLKIGFENAVTIYNTHRP